jgi:glycosyltransferase involved in cell wall biosynthesis
MDTGQAELDLSVIIPVYNEEECIGPTIRELCGVLQTLGLRSEVIAIDDGSTDQTRASLSRLAVEFPVLRALTITPNSGQSAALGVGFREARGAAVVTMDADGQNDPADIPKLLAELKNADVCCGIRARRQDTAAKRIGSRLANRIRQGILKDGIVDTGCTLKAFKTPFVRDLAMWKGMHRFLPALAQMQGAAIAQIPVNHRPRAGGRSKYTNFGRLKQTIWDLWAVRWMQKRNPRFKVEKE